ncbi:trace amine-associated receptor 1-like [Parambassis ranga]|uniref:Trace amine-associated receptor 1-like n=1 Tax=Parambassis ranga TaxID=210632 RepID=A0A6P7HNR2_9TELE|nr:trace amine-associated receptor 1-like [Parambassis ranga]
MKTEVTVNWTDVGTYTYQCSKTVNFNNILANSQSTICGLLYVFIGLLAVITTCGNLLVIISIIYFKQLHTPTNSLILSLAVADLMVGIILFPLSMVFSFKSCLYFDGIFCSVRGSFDICLSTCSILNLGCISVDRYYAVCQPLTYRAKINHCVVVIMILICWGVSALIGIGIVIAGLNSKNCGNRCLIEILMKNTIGPILSFYLPVIIMLCMYLKIFLVAQRQARSIHNTTKCGAAVSKMERKATKTLAIVLGVFLFCWSPFFLCLTFLPLTNGAAPISLIESLRWLALSNSMLNPLIYAFFYSWFRSAFRMIISGKIFQGDFTNYKLH